MNWLKRLPGFQRSPPGLEWVLLRLMPAVLAAGTFLPALAALAARYLMTGATDAELERSILLFDFGMIGVVILVWTLAATVTMLCHCVAHEEPSLRRRWI
jgi:hypothetical protein